MTNARPKKNIVLCSDGTGQSGSKVTGTNVWKIRMGVERHRHDYDAKPQQRRQIVYYDAGVGTSALSVKKTLGSAFGYGLAANMRELYLSLVRSYNEGDYIYIFGFSRGAFTARSLAGMISEVGIIKRRYRDGDAERQLDDDDLEKLVANAYRAYRKSKKGRPIEKFHQANKTFTTRRRAVVEVHSHENARVHFTGVWDTVDAYGMPIDELNVLIYDLILNKFKRPHNDQLTDKMDHAFHAMAIDEERRSFAPTLYDVKDNGPGKGTDVDVEQVWFAGAHSNVGGGYPRQGLSDEALEWMMTKAEQHGLHFTQGSRDEVRRERDGNSTIYDQRSGPGVIWRYKPRDIGKLCEQAGVHPKIHFSALKRIDLATSGYGPITLPARFEVVGYGRNAEQTKLHPSDDDDRIAFYNDLVKASTKSRGAGAAAGKRLIRRRTAVYYMLLAALAVIGFFAIRWHLDPAAAQTYEEVSVVRKIGEAISEAVPFVNKPTIWVWTQITNGVLAVSPFGWLDRFIETTFRRRPEFVVSAALVGLVLWVWHLILVKKIRLHGLGLWRQAFHGPDVQRPTRRASTSSSAS